MKLSKWSYWVQGGFIGLFMGLTLLLISHFEQDISSPTEVFSQCSPFAHPGYSTQVTVINCPLPMVFISALHQIVFIIFSLPLSYIWYLLDKNISDPIYYTNFIFGYIFLGLIIGWFYEKIKNYKKINWGNWSYMVKGAIIIELISLLALIPLFISNIDSPSGFINDPPGPLILHVIVWFPFILAYNFYTWSFVHHFEPCSGFCALRDIPDIWTIIFGVVTSNFLVGGFLGWLYGKIKTRINLNAKR